MTTKHHHKIARLAPVRSKKEYYPSDAFIFSSNLSDWQHSKLRQSNYKRKNANGQ